MTYTEDEKKLKSGFNIPEDYDSHVWAYWLSYYPFVPPAYKKYKGQKQAS